MMANGIERDRVAAAGRGSHPYTSLSPSLLAVITRLSDIHYPSHHLHWPTSGVERNRVAAGRGLHPYFNTTLPISCHHQD